MILDIELLERELKYKSKTGEVVKDDFKIPKMPKKRDAKAIDKGKDEFIARTRTYEKEQSVEGMVFIMY
jgi:hypothetical protein